MTELTDAEAAYEAARTAYLAAREAYITARINARIAIRDKAKEGDR